jgi:hypothetical protein
VSVSSFAFRTWGRSLIQPVRRFPRPNDKD